MIMQVGFVSIPVRDTERAVAFYTNKLGFHLVTDQQTDDGGRWVELEPPGAAMRIALYTERNADERIGRRAHIAFQADDVTLTFEQLRARGVAFTRPPMEQPGGMSAAFVDPDGNEFLIATQDL